MHIDRRRGKGKMVGQGLPYVFHLNIEHPTSNIEHRTEEKMVGKRVRQDREVVVPEARSFVACRKNAAKPSVVLTPTASPGQIASSWTPRNDGEERIPCNGGFS